MEWRVQMSLNRTSGLLLLAGVLATAACVAPSSDERPANGSWRLSGKVSSTAGAPIAGARLTVQDGANRDARVSSDPSGSFEFAKLESGRFKVIIEAPGFESVTPVVELYWDVDVAFALRRPDEAR
jgi:Carboxypeptidase regulatory-like domain